MESLTAHADPLTAASLRPAGSAHGSLLRRLFAVFLIATVTINLTDRLHNATQMELLTLISFRAHIDLESSYMRTLKIS